jgi:hypothetical protein
MDPLLTSNFRQWKLAKWIAKDSTKFGVLGFVRGNQSFTRFALQSNKQVAYPPTGSAFPWKLTCGSRIGDNRMNALKLLCLGRTKRL